jgi:predicted pyridoxine 5'-phosphate oxidase superfamily flavin-nucleotide-binding protein
LEQRKACSRYSINRLKRLWLHLNNRRVMSFSVGYKKERMGTGWI